MSAQIRENLVLSPCPKNVRTGLTPLPPLSVRTTINFEKSGFFYIKGIPMSALDKTPSPLTADVLYGQPLD